MHQLMAERGEALQVAPVARRRRVDRADARPALHRRLVPLRAAEDVEEVLAPGERLARRVRLLHAIPHHRDAGIGRRRGGTAGQEKDEKKNSQASSIRPTSRPSAYLTPTMRPPSRAMSRNISASRPRVPNWLACAAIASILASMVSVTSM